MNFEIERKFLVGQLPEGVEHYPHMAIEQAYLCTTPTVRVRRAGDCYWLTVKEHRDAQGMLSNREEEFRLAAEKYALLLRKCDGNVVSKTRYKVDLRRMECDGLYTYHMAEVDLFHGVLEGLRMVEVEFPSEAEARAFQPPAWFGQEVSDDPRFRNAWLANCNADEVLDYYHSTIKQ